jgi:hypothetical protein
MFVYSKFSELLAGAGNFTSDVFRVLLERSTSTYVPNIDHDFLDDFTTGGGVEITVASYARQTLGGKSITPDLANDRTGLFCSTVAFGSLETGQTVKAVLGYRQTGGNDATPADDEMMFYYDGKIDVYLAADAALNATTLWVDPLVAPLASGTSLDFGGGGTCSLTSSAAKGARSVAVSALGAARSAGAVSTGVPISGNILPFVLGGGAFNVTIDAAGLIQYRRPSGPA